MLQLLKKGVPRKPAKGRCAKSKVSTAGDDGAKIFFSAGSARSSSYRSKAQGSLHLLKDLKKIQTSLRDDDIVWDS